jgi:phage terminase large subunit-like protein
MKHSTALQADWQALRPEQRAALTARSDWLATARPDQITPDGNWNTWVILAGRGWGKTRTGAEDAAWAGLSNPGWRIAVVAPTSADARDTCVEGDSGLMSILPREAVQTWNRSLGELILINGSRYKCFSADEPERLRGPQHHRAWADELAAWRYPEAWDQLMFGLRLGDHPQAVVTTTPKPSPLVKALVAAGTSKVTRGSTFDNAANLAPSGN